MKKRTPEEYYRRADWAFAFAVACILIAIVCFFASEHAPRRTFIILIPTYAVIIVAETALVFLVRRRRAATLREYNETLRRIRAPMN